MGKGGGYGRTFGGGIGVRLRHHNWTGTTDLPRNPVPPVNGGLEKKPSPWKRSINWFKFIVRQLKKEFHSRWERRREP